MWNSLITVAVNISSKVAVESLAKIFLDSSGSPAKSLTIKLGTALASTVTAGVVTHLVDRKVNEIKEIVNPSEGKDEGDTKETSESGVA